MKVTPRIKKVIAAIESKDSFSFDEIFDATTEIKPRLFEPLLNRINQERAVYHSTALMPFGKETKYVTSNERIVAIDLEQINGVIETLAAKGLLEREPNTVAVKVVRFVHEQTNEDFTNASQIFENYSQYRYTKYKDFDFFVKNKFQTSEEKELESERKKKELREWLPIIVSVAGLLLSSVPAWVNIISRPSSPEKIVIYDEQVQRKLATIEDEIKKLANLTKSPPASISVTDSSRK